MEFYLKSVHGFSRKGWFHQYTLKSLLFVSNFPPKSSSLFQDDKNNYQQKDTKHLSCSEFHQLSDGLNHFCCRSLFEAEKHWLSGQIENPMILKPNFWWFHFIGIFKPQKVSYSKKESVQQKADEILNKKDASYLSVYNVFEPLEIKRKIWGKVEEKKCTNMKPPHSTKFIVTFKNQNQNEFVNCFHQPI